MPGAWNFGEKRRRGLRRGSNSSLRAALSRPRPGEPSATHGPPGRHEGPWWDPHSSMTGGRPAGSSRCSRRRRRPSPRAWPSSPAQLRRPPTPSSSARPPMARSSRWSSPCSAAVWCAAAHHPDHRYELLRDGGFTTEGTRHDGPGFICRLGNGSFNSGPQYPTPATEDCVLTRRPPPTGRTGSPRPARRAGPTVRSAPWTASPGRATWTPGCSAGRTSAAPPADPPSRPTTSARAGGTTPNRRTPRRTARACRSGRSTWRPPPAG
ncbi:hypothetical protein SMICM17S_11528 [Streptomyces microflavus]